MKPIAASLLAAGLSAVSLMAATPALAQDDAADAAWAAATADEALKQCPPGTLSAEQATDAAEAAGWPKFKSKKIDGLPSRVSIRPMRPGERAGTQVALVFQTTGVSPVRALRCVIQTTPAIGTTLKERLTARYGPEGKDGSGWWMKRTAEGLQPLSREEQITILDGPRLLLLKLKSEDQIVFAFEETSGLVSVATVETFANP
jgi:hypothetical protein